MRRAKMVGLCVVVACALSGVAAAEASPIEFAWKVGGEMLASGASREVTSNAKSAQVLKTTGVEITCREVATPGARIAGGVAGTSSETVEFQRCAVQEPSGCRVKEEKITSRPLKDEIVEGVGSSAGRVLVVFMPAEGETFAEPKLSGGLLCISVAVKGSLLAEPSPQKQEATTVTLKFEPAEAKRYRNSKEEERPAGLTVGEDAVTVAGEDETALAGGEAFGAF